MINANFNIESIDFLMREVLGMELIEINNGRYHYHKLNTESEYDVSREYFIDIYEGWNYRYGVNSINFKRDKYINGHSESKSYDIRHYPIGNESWEEFLSDLSMKTFSATDSLCEDEITGRFNRLHSIYKLLEV